MRPVMRTRPRSVMRALLHARPSPGDPLRRGLMVLSCRNTVVGATAYALMSALRASATTYACRRALRVDSCDQRCVDR